MLLWQRSSSCPRKSALSLGHRQWATYISSCFLEAGALRILDDYNAHRTSTTYHGGKRQSIGLKSNVIPMVVRSTYCTYWRTGRCGPVVPLSGGVAQSLLLATNCRVRLRGEGLGTSNGPQWGSPAQQSSAVHSSASRESTINGCPHGRCWTGGREYIGVPASKVGSLLVQHCVAATIRSSTGTNSWECRAFCKCARALGKMRTPATKCTSREEQILPPLCCPGLANANAQAARFGLQELSGACKHRIHKGEELDPGVSDTGHSDSP